MSPRRAPEAEPGRGLLTDLARAVMEDWPRGQHAEPEALHAELDRIVSWVAARMDSGPGEAPAPPEPDDRFLQRRLLESLRLRCLRRWAEPGEYRDTDAVACLDLLVLLDQLGRASLPEDARDLASRLADPDGFELLVELAHDLRSPLTSISFLAETLRGGFSGDLNEQQRHQLGLIYSAALAMQSVVTDVMDLARHGADVLDEDVTAFALSDVFDGVRRLVEPIAQVKGLELRASVPDHQRVQGRPTALGRVILNLVTNGLKFTESGYVEMAATWVGHDEVEISVRDTGRGIDPESQDAMFQPFRKARDRPGSFFSGSGLGLSVVRRLVEALGSELEFETRPDWGTRFYFRMALRSVRHY